MDSVWSYFKIINEIGYEILQTNEILVTDTVWPVDNKDDIPGHVADSIYNKKRLL